MKTFKDNWFIILIVLAIIISLPKQCGKTITKVETKTVYKDRIDTIKVTEIKEVYKPVYIEKIKTVKGKDSIIYVDKPTNTSIEANVYDAIVKTDSSSAELKITSLTRPLDIRGVIKCKEKETITTITNTKNASGLFIFADVPITNTNFSPELGLIYQVKNNFLIKASVQYNSFTNKVDLVGGIGINIFNK